MPASTTTHQQDEQAFTLRNAGVTYASISDQLGLTVTQVYGAISRHAARNNLPDPIRRTSLRRASRYARRAGLPFDADAFAAGTASAMAEEMGGAFLTGRTFGIEIEFRRPRGEGRSLIDQETIAEALRAAGLEAHAESYNHQTRSHWKLITDASSDQELVSPVLSGREGLRQVRTAMKVLRQLGCRVGTSEGMHVHVYAGDLPATRVADAFGFYAARQTTMFNNLVSRSRRNAYYCMPVNANDAQRTRELCRRGRVGAATGRYVSVNLESYARYETIEFRQHQGSLNGRKACDWIELLLGMMTLIEQGAERACPTTLDGTITYLVAGRLLKQATADRLMRKAIGYGWIAPSDPSAVSAIEFAQNPADPAGVAAPAASPQGHIAHGERNTDPDRVTNFINQGCTCLACVSAYGQFLDGECGLRVIYTDGTLGDRAHQDSNNGWQGITDLAACENVRNAYYAERQLLTDGAF